MSTSSVPRPALDEYRESVRALIRANPEVFGAEAWDHTQLLPPAREAIAALGGAGLLDPVIGADPSRAVAFSAVLHETLAPLPAGAVVLTHTEVGSRLLAHVCASGHPAVAAARQGRHLTALAVTEPGGGLDFDAMTTIVERDEQDGRATLRGEKWFISNAPFADEFFVLARDTRFAKRAPGRHTLLRVPARTPGVGVDSLSTFGHRGLVGRVRLDHVQLPGEAAAGAPGSGLLTLMRHWVHERVMLAVRQTAMAAWLAHDSQVRVLRDELLCEQAAGARAVRHLAQATCTPREAASAKLRSGRLLRRVAEQAMRRKPSAVAERVLRDAHGLALAGGSDEALLMQIARSLP
ncbi:acyl-CoA dehydrogenase family protein [Streptomyces sp. NPDC055400]